MINQRTWVKTHKKSFANELITKSGATPDGNPTAIFMAGLPGAGKTEFSKNLLGIFNYKVVRLDMDEIATHIKGYKPEKADLFRSGATELLNKTFDLVIKQQLDFIMDGTFGSKNAKLNISRSLKSGYLIKILYIYQDPKLAWHFTKEREKIEHRAISKDGFIETYFNTIENIKTILQDYDGEKLTLDIVTKNSYNKISKWYHDVKLSEIDNLINNCYNKENLKEHIDG